VDLIFCERCGRRIPAKTRTGLCASCEAETGAALSGRQKLAVSLGPAFWLAVLTVAAILTIIVWLVRARADHLPDRAPAEAKGFSR
jgi:hypothetical protein